MSQFGIDNMSQSHRGTRWLNFDIRRRHIHGNHPTSRDGISHTWRTLGVRASTGTTYLGDTLCVGFTVPSASQRASSLRKDKNSAM